MGRIGIATTVQPKQSREGHTGVVIIELGTTGSLTRHVCDVSFFYYMTYVEGSTQFQQSQGYGVMK